MCIYFLNFVYRIYRMLLLGVKALYSVQSKIWCVKQCIHKMKIQISWSTKTRFLYFERPTLN